jgi:hypothetical protein
VRSQWEPFAGCLVTVNSYDRVPEENVHVNFNPPGISIDRVR